MLPFACFTLLADNWRVFPWLVELARRVSLIDAIGAIRRYRSIRRLARGSTCFRALVGIMAFLLAFVAGNIA